MVIRRVGWWGPHHRRTWWSILVTGICGVAVAVLSMWVVVGNIGGGCPWVVRVHRQHTWWWGLVSLMWVVVDVGGWSKGCGYIIDARGGS